MDAEEKDADAPSVVTTKQRADYNVNKETINMKFDISSPIRFSSLDFLLYQQVREKR